MDPSRTVRRVPEAAVGCFDTSGAAFTYREPGLLDAATRATLFSDDFADYSKWTNVKNSWSVADGQAVSGGTGVCLARPTTTYAAKSVRVALKLTMPNSEGYAAIPLRAVLGTGASADKFNGYEVVVTRKVTEPTSDTLSFQIAVNSGGQGQLQTASTAVAVTTDQRAMVIRLQGFWCRVWLSADSNWPDETAAPTLSVYDPAETYARGGWVGMLTSGVAGVQIDDMTVEEIVRIEARPPRTYAGYRSAVTIDSTSDLAAVSLVGPDGLAHELLSPSDVVGENSATIHFPDSFEGMENPPTGGYLLSASTSGSSSVLPLEIRENPLVRFAFMTDTHIKKAGNWQTDNAAQAVWEVQNEVAWPRPHFLAHGGDVIEGDIWNDWSLQFAKAAEILGTLSIPAFITAGNHDTFWSGSEWIDHGAMFVSTFGDISRYWVKAGFLFILTSYTALDGGYDNADDAECLAFIDAAMDAHPSHKVILFGHPNWAPAICDGSPHLASDLRSDGSAHTLSPEIAPNALALIEANANVLARIAGNAHVNAAVKLNDVWHFTRASVKVDREWTYVELYSDRMVVHTVPMLTHYGDGRLLTWDDETDTLHPTDILYARGLPMERDYTLWFADRSLDIGHCIAPDGPGRVANGTLSANVTCNYEHRQGGTWAGLVFRQQDPRNYYAVLLCSDRQEIVLQCIEDGVATELAAVALEITQGTPIAVVVTLNGTAITVTCDAVGKIDTTDSTFTTGTYGVKTSRGDAVVGPITYQELGT